MYFMPIIYETVQGPIESQIAVNQLKDNVVDYSIARAVATSNLILNIIYFVLISLLFVIWTNPIISILKKKEERENEKDNSIN